MAGSGRLQPFVITGRYDRAQEPEEWPALAEALRGATRQPDAGIDRDLLADLRFSQLWTLRMAPWGYRSNDLDEPLRLEDEALDDLLERGSLTGAWPSIFETPGSMTLAPRLQLVPRRQVTELESVEVNTDVVERYRGSFYAIGTWGAADDDDFTDLETECSPEPAAALELGAVAPFPDEDCPPGWVHQLQPNEGRDFVRWAFHSGTGRSYDPDRGDGLDEVLLRPEQHLERWQGEPILRNDLLVGRYGVDPVRCTYPGIATGSSAAVSLVDGVVRPFTISEHPDLELYRGDYPYDPLGVDPLSEEAAGCLRTPWVVGAGLGAALVLLLLAVLLLDGDDSPSTDRTDAAAAAEDGDESQAGEASNDEDATTEGEGGLPEGAQSFVTSDDEDLTRVADQSEAPGADPLAEIIAVEAVELDDMSHTVTIFVVGDTVPIDEARRSADSSAYRVVVEYADGSSGDWVWELHLGELRDGEDQTSKRGPADVSFTSDTVRFDLNDGGVAAQRITVMTFSNLEFGPDESGPEFFDEAFLDVVPAQSVN